MLRLKIHADGFGLVEVLALIVVVGILAAIALQSMSVVVEDARTIKTKREMVMLSEAIAGNPSLMQSGVRSEFGYLGDNGAFPPTLQALLQNPGLGTWNGPYLPPGFAEDTTGFKLDEWGKAYSYDGTITITSSGSGSTLTLKIGRNADDFLVNTIDGRIVDNAGSPPGVYADSIDIEVDCPDGAGTLVTRSQHPGSSGAFALDSVPAGRHPLRLIYQPEVDTLHREVTVLPRNRGSLDYRFAEAYFTSGSSGSSGTDTLLFAVFTANDEGFTYGDDAFRSTSQPLYASGSWSGSVGYAGGGLEVDLGGLNNNYIANMSGGWQISFTVPTPAAVTVSFWYELRQDRNYESDEYTEALMSVDGTLYGQSATDYVDRIYGDGNGGPQITTGWQQFSANLGTLSAGNHSLTVGGYNNKKNSNSEESWIAFDEVLVVSGN